MCRIKGDCLDFRVSRGIYLDAGRRTCGARNERRSVAGCTSVLSVEVKWNVCKRNLSSLNPNISPFSKQNAIQSCPHCAIELSKPSYPWNLIDDQHLLFVLCHPTLALFPLTILTSSLLTSSLLTSSHKRSNLFTFLTSHYVGDNRTTYFGAMWRGW